MSLPRILLASNSPRRRELLALTGWPFEVHPANVDESRRAGEPPVEYVLRLAETKARTVAAEAKPGQLILAADTIVALGDDLLGKPETPAEAKQMLERLRGETHQVYTAVAVFDPSTGQLERDLCASDVLMRNYRDEEIDEYVASGDPLDKAGAYAIQNEAFHPVERYTGCFSSIMGLPLCHLTRTLRKFDLTADVDVPAVCQDHFDTDCPHYTTVLSGRQAGD